MDAADADAADDVRFGERQPGEPTVRVGCDGPQPLYNSRRAVREGRVDVVRIGAAAAAVSIESLPLDVARRRMS